MVQGQARPYPTKILLATDGSKEAELASLEPLLSWGRPTGRPYLELVLNKFETSDLSKLRSRVGLE